MIRANIDDKKFMRDMNNLVGYTRGFLEGVESSKGEILNKVGADVVERLKQFVDANARVNPAALNHMYEWSATGSPAARLFDIDYLSDGLGLSFVATYRQSNTVAEGSKTPFYDKARVMEEGIPVTIRPKRKVLAFKDEDGEDVFTPNAVVVNNPGGSETTGSFEDAIENFFASYFTQSYLQSSQIFDYLKNPFPYANEMQRGLRGGASYGRAVGKRWASGGMS